MVETQDFMFRELARGTVELAVLALLKSRPMYGYELLTIYNSTLRGPSQLKEGTLYPILHRLEDAGFVATLWEAEGRGPPRKYYSLTDSGLTRFKTLRNAWAQLASGMAELMEGLHPPSPNVKLKERARPAGRSQNAGGVEKSRRRMG